jgi:hypothetical protein
MSTGCGPRWAKLTDVQVQADGQKKVLAFEFLIDGKTKVGPRYLTIDATKHASIFNGVAKNQVWVVHLDARNEICRDVMPKLASQQCTSAYPVCGNVPAVAPSTACEARFGLVVAVTPDIAANRTPGGERTVTFKLFFNNTEWPPVKFTPPVGSAAYNARPGQLWAVHVAWDPETKAYKVCPTPAPTLYRQQCASDADPAPVCRFRNQVGTIYNSQCQVWAGLVTYTEMIGDTKRVHLLFKFDGQPKHAWYDATKDERIYAAMVGDVWRVALDDTRKACRPNTPSAGPVRHDKLCTDADPPKACEYSRYVGKPPPYFATPTYTPAPPKTCWPRFGLVTRVTPDVAAKRTPGESRTVEFTFFFDGKKVVKPFTPAVGSNAYDALPGQVWTVHLDKNNVPCATPAPTLFRAQCTSNTEPVPVCQFRNEVVGIFNSPCQQWTGLVERVVTLDDAKKVHLVFKFNDQAVRHVVEIKKGNAGYADMYARVKPGQLWKVALDANRRVCQPTGAGAGPQLHKERCNDGDADKACEYNVCSPWAGRLVDVKLPVGTEREMTFRFSFDGQALDLPYTAKKGEDAYTKAAVGQLWKVHLDVGRRMCTKPGQVIPTFHKQQCSPNDTYATCLLGPIGHPVTPPAPPVIFPEPKDKVAMPPTNFPIAMEMTIGTTPTPVVGNRACPAVYQPVCGANGTTYSNSCVAGQAGVSQFVDGACVDTGNPGDPPSATHEARVKSVKFLKDDRKDIVFEFDFGPENVPVVKHYVAKPGTQVYNASENELWTVWLTARNGEVRDSPAPKYKGRCEQGAKDGPCAFAPGNVYADSGCCPKGWQASEDSRFCMRQRDDGKLMTEPSTCDRPGHHYRPRPGYGGGIGSWGYGGDDERGRRRKNPWWMGGDDGWDKYAPDPWRNRWDGTFDDEFQRVGPGDRRGERPDFPNRPGRPMPGRECASRGPGAFEACCEEKDSKNEYDRSCDRWNLEDNTKDTWMEANGYPPGTKTPAPHTRWPRRRHRDDDDDDDRKHDRRDDAKKNRGTGGETAGTVGVTATKQEDTQPLTPDPSITVELKVDNANEGSNDNSGGGGVVGGLWPGELWPGPVFSAPVVPQVPQLVPQLPVVPPLPTWCARP